MIVATNFQFHDDESEMLVFDTDKLNTNNKFEKDLKKALENKKYLQLDGEEYQDDWGKYRDAIVKQESIKIDRSCKVHVFFDC